MGTTAPSEGQLARTVDHVRPTEHPIGADEAAVWGDHASLDAVRARIAPELAGRIPLLVAPSDALRFAVDGSWLGFTHHLRFGDPAVEAAYVAFSQDRTYYPVAVAAFVECLFGVQFVAIVNGDQLASGRIVWANGTVVQLIAAALQALCCVVVVVLQCTRRGVFPRGIEAAWVLCAATWCITIQTDARSHLLRVCALEKQHGRPVYDSARCDWFNDGESFVAFIAFFINTPRSLFAVATAAVSLVLYFVWRWAFLGFSMYVNDSSYVLVIVMSALMLHGNELNTRARFVQAQTLLLKLAQTQMARDEVNGMLRGLLATSVVDRLVKGEVIADSRDATVLYSDVAGFTNWSSSRSAADVVRMLNTMYKLFDQHVVSYGVEKITTIGDAYWAAANIPTPIENHADRVTAFAMCMQHQVREMQTTAPEFGEIQVRIGVHSGEVCGGVSGSLLIAYQIFGDTTEDAELIEQLAPEGQVLVSEAVVQRLRNLNRALLPGPVIDRGDETSLRTYVVHAFLPAEAPSAGPPLPTPALLDMSMSLGSRRLSHSTTLSDSVSERAETNARLRAVILQSSFRSEAIGERGGMGRRLSISSSNLARRASSRLLDSAEGAVVVAASAAPDDSPPAENPLAFRTPAPVGTASGLEGNEDRAPSPVVVHGRDGVEVGDALTSQHRVDVMRRALSRRKYRWALQTFADPQTEERYQEFAGVLFQRATGRVHGALTLFLLLMTILLFCEQAAGQPVAAYAIYVVITASSAAVAALSRRINAYASFAHFYAVGALQLAVFLIARPSFVSSNSVWLTTIAMLLTCAQWSPGVSFVWVTTLNFVWFSLPQVFISVRSVDYIITTSTVGPTVAWIIAGYRYERGARQQFIDAHVARLADEEASSERENVHKLLSKTLPGFVLPVVVAWMGARRSGSIAHTYPRAGVMFFRVPRLVADLAGQDARERMAAVADVVEIYDAAIAKHAHCVKIKTIGDVVLVAAGLEVELRRSPGGGGGAALDAYEQLMEDSSADLADLALELQAAVQRDTERTGAAGLHCGPIVGGVLGDERLIYDVFGDVVNCASRILSTSGGAGVWASEAFVASVGRRHGERFVFEAPVVRSMKGKGQLAVRLVGSPRRPPEPPSATMGAIDSSHSRSAPSCDPSRGAANTPVMEDIHT